MRTVLEFYDAQSGKASDCGQSLEITESNRDLSWDGILLEKGTSPNFYPENIRTPYFYFALALDLPFHWKVNLNQEDRELITHPDEIWINPPGVAFTHKIAEPCAFLILAIKEKRFLQAFPPGTQSLPLEYLSDYNVVDPGLKNLIEMFYLEARRGGSTGAAYLDSMLGIFATYYLNHYSNYPEFLNKKGSSTFGAKEFATVQDFYQSHLQTAPLLEEVASLVHMSPFHFLREFKKYSGITPHQFLLQLRIDRAKNLLGNHKITLAEVAYDLGFSDQSHFSRTFKKISGQSPKTYRSRLGK